MPRRRSRPKRGSLGDRARQVRRRGRTQPHGCGGSCAAAWSCRWPDCARWRQPWVHASLDRLKTALQSAPDPAPRIERGLRITRELRPCDCSGAAELRCARRRTASAGQVPGWTTRVLAGFGARLRRRAARWCATARADSGGRGLAALPLPDRCALTALGPATGTRSVFPADGASHAAGRGGGRRRSSGSWTPAGCSIAAAATSWPRGVRCAHLAGRRSGP